MVYFAECILQNKQTWCQISNQCFHYIGESIHVYLSLVFCASNIKAHFNIFVSNFLLWFFLNRLQFN
jgi:hypothetical protein